MSCYLVKGCQKDSNFLQPITCKKYCAFNYLISEMLQKKARGDTHNNYSFAHGQIENEWLSFTLLAHLTMLQIKIESSLNITLLNVLPYELTS